MLLEIKDLCAGINGKEILKGVNLQINKGEVHAIMGPNGTGKSTLASIIAGRPGYDITGGDILLDGKSLLGMPPEQRAQEGIFLGFQYPVEIPGVSMSSFLRAAINETRRYRGQLPLGAVAFARRMKEKEEMVEIKAKMKNRSVNEGFSGGEKKKNEIFQLAMLEPKVAILDETDSGLDIDALRIVAGGVNKCKTEENATVVITHYQRLLEYIVPDYVHILYGGRVVKTGGRELSLELEEKGYDWIKAQVEGEE
jgi:Fe-S cluster assembly ATP-binding protein